MGVKSCLKRILDQQEVGDVVEAVLYAPKSL